MCGPGRRRNNTTRAKTMTAGILGVLPWMRVLRTGQLQYFQLWVAAGQLVIGLDQILNRYTLFTIIFSSAFPPYPSLSTILIFHIETWTRINEVICSWPGWVFLFSFHVRIRMRKEKVT